MTYRREFCLPDLGFDESPMRVSLWLASHGDYVERGAPLVEVLAGGGVALVDLPSPCSGTLVEIRVSEDDVISVGQPLAVLRLGDVGVS